MAVASVASGAATEVLMPGSEDEAIAAFGDGAEVVVVGGGTIVVPDLTYRRLRPAKALMLGNAGLSGIEKDGSRVTISDEGKRLEAEVVTKPFYDPDGEVLRS